MKNSLKYLKVLMWPIIFIIGSFLVNYIFVAVYNSKLNLNNNELIEYIKTIEYQEKLNNYISSKALIIALIIAIIFIPVLYRTYKKYKKENKFNYKNVLEPILFGITISLIFNIIVFNINNIFHFTNNYELSNVPIMIQIICSGIIGPILEELLYRGIVYNKLKEFNKPMVSIILTSLLFAIFHDNLLNAIYAFGVSFMFIYLYEKYKTLKAPIIMHMSLNITIVLMLRLIICNYIIFNTYLLIVSIIVLMFLKKVCIKKQ